MKKVFMIALVTMICGCTCTDPQGAKEALQSQGFSDIEITGYKMFMCSENDVYSTGMFFKGSTIRY